ncbi:ATP-binding protein [Streptomyces sp. NPDC051561]|uniref:ATP-binding protein n=1 Tax=Streptomyces sp. NPDC051561 TaxID=3365658 RepID=UPI0037A56B77
MATVSPLWSYTLQLPHDPRAPGIARSTLRAVLRSHGLNQLFETAELLASELVTNVYLHTFGDYALRLRDCGGGRVRVGVWDTSPFIPAAFDKGADEPWEGAESGRGLFLVRLCADDWGAHLLGDSLFGCNGKLLWAECGPAAH